MKKVLGVTLISTFIILLFSCNDDDDNYSNLLEDTKSYFPSEVGNYWEYEVWSIYSDGSEKLHYIDSTKISKEIDINGKRYFVIQSKEATLGGKSISNWIDKWYLTDSVGYFFDWKKDIYFSNTNFTDTLRHYYYYAPGTDRLEYKISFKMEKVDTLVVVPAGSFSNALDWQGTVIVNDYYTVKYKNPRYTNTYYVRNVGIIFERQFYLSSGTYIEHRLKSYRINGITYPSK